MKAHHITFDPSGESVQALYLNGSLYMHGDYQHDKIGVRIESFLEGLSFTGATIDIEKLDVPFDFCRSITEDGQEPPGNWPDPGFAMARHAVRAT